MLTRGGICPRDTKYASKPGKLRLLDEANPISIIVGQARGMFSTGYECIDLGGSKNEVGVVLGYH